MCCAVTFLHFGRCSPSPGITSFPANTQCLHSHNNPLYALFVPQINLNHLANRFKNPVDSTNLLTYTNYQTFLLRAYEVRRESSVLEGTRSLVPIPFPASGHRSFPGRGGYPVSGPKSFQRVGGGPGYRFPSHYQGRGEVSLT